MLAAELNGTATLPVSTLMEMADLLKSKALTLEDVEDEKTRFRAFLLARLETGNTNALTTLLATDYNTLKDFLLLEENNIFPVISNIANTLSGRKDVSSKQIKAILENLITLKPSKIIPIICSTPEFVTFVCNNNALDDILRELFENKETNREHVRNLFNNATSEGKIQIFLSVAQKQIEATDSAKGTYGYLNLQPNEDGKKTSY